MSRIPIENIYFLLCYAWNRLEEREIVNIQTEGVQRLPDLFGRVLVSGVSHVLKRGLDRSYLVHEARIPGIRGKFLLSKTVTHNLLPQARTYCEFDELSYDVLHNQIIKATLRDLLKVGSLDPQLRERLTGIYRRLNHISNIRLSLSAFRAVQLHRNIRFYDFLIKVSRLIYDNLMINESQGIAKFRDFMRDEKKMSVLFQQFLYNFFRLEKREYHVSSRKIPWHAATASTADLAYLPGMHTDIVLRSTERTIIVDAKYYRDAFQINRGKRTVKSAHLYQMMAYLINLQAAEGRSVEGLVLYPTVDMDFDFNYVLNGHKLSLRTIDFTRPWQDVASALLRVVR